MPESQQKAIPINRYVIFKTNNGYFEGRVVDVNTDNNKTLYSVISFATFEYFRVNENELITQCSADSKRKYGPSEYCDNYTSIRMPSVLKNRLQADKDYCMVNCIFDKLNEPKNIKDVLNDFAEFFRTNSLMYDQTEIIQMVQGYIHLFNTFLPVSLLYENEIKYFNDIDMFNMNADYTEIFGPTHLLRLLYFIQHKSKYFVHKKSTAMIISDYTIYLVDFLNCRYSDYFY